MRSRRFVRSLPAGLLALALLAACGDDSAEDPEGAADAAEAADASPTLSSRTLGGDPLDLDQASLAVLTAANLPGFEVDGQGPTPAEPPDETDGLPVCETNDTFEDRFDYARIAPTRVVQTLVFTDEARLLFVSSTVASFQNDDQAEAALDEFATQFDDCDDFVDTEDGVSVSIAIEKDDEAVSSDVDDAFNMTATGTYVDPGAEEFAMGFGFSLARVDNNVTFTEIVSLGVADDRTLLEPYTGLAVDRLVAVMNDEVPEDVAGPPPTPAPPASRLPGETGGFSLEQFSAVAPRYGLG